MAVSTSGDLKAFILNESNTSINSTKNQIFGEQKRANSTETVTPNGSVNGAPIEQNLQSSSDNFEIKFDKSLTIREDDEDFCDHTFGELKKETAFETQEETAMLTEDANGNERGVDENKNVAGIDKKDSAGDISDILHSMEKFADEEKQKLEEADENMNSAEKAQHENAVDIDAGKEKDADESQPVSLSTISPEAQSNDTERINSYMSFSPSQTLDKDVVKQFCDKHSDKIRAYIQGIASMIPLPVECGIDEIGDKAKKATKKYMKYLNLNFTCFHKGNCCLFERNYFEVKTEHADIWIHLMFLALQVSSLMIK